MLIDLIPNCSNFSFAYLFMQNFAHLTQKQVFVLSAKTGWYITNADMLVKEAVTLAFPFSDLIFAIPGLYIIGTSVRYMQTLAKNNVVQIKAIWKNSFYGTLFFSLFSMCVIFVLIQYITPLQTQLIQIKNYKAIIIKYHGVFDGVNLHTFYLDCLNYDFNAYSDAVWWAKQFLFELNGFLWIQSIIGIYVTALRSEGFLGFVTYTTIGCIALNLLLDWVFISVVQIGMMGAATATILGWSVQLIILIFYTHQKIEHHVMTTDLFNKRISIQWRLIFLIAKFGATVFISQLCAMVIDVCLVSEMSHVSATLYPQKGTIFFLAIAGAVSPIVSLFYRPVFGVVRYGSPFFSYNYQKRNFQRLRVGYYLFVFITLIYGLTFYFLIAFIPQVTVWSLSLFHLAKDLTFAVHLIKLWLMQIFLLSLGTGSMMLFVSANRIKIATFLNFLRSSFVPLIFIYLCGSLAILSHHIWTFYACFPWMAFIANIILFFWGSIFLFRDVKILFDKNSKLIYMQQIKIVTN